MRPSVPYNLKQMHLSYLYPVKNASNGITTDYFFILRLLFLSAKIFLHGLCWCFREERVTCVILTLVVSGPWNTSAYPVFSPLCSVFVVEEAVLCLKLERT